MDEGAATTVRGSTTSKAKPDLDDDHRAQAQRALAEVEGGHGATCVCPYAKTAVSLGMPRATIEAMRLRLPHGTRITAWVLANNANVLDDDAFIQLLGNLRRLVKAECLPAREEGERPFVPWRNFKRVGVHSPDDRWPDEWEAWEWANFYRGLEDPTDQAPTTDDAHSRAAARLASRTWQWSSPPDEAGQIDVDRWSRDDLVRALGLLQNASDLPWILRLSDLEWISRRAGRVLSETVRFVRYVDLCRQGLATPNEATRILIDSYSVKTPDELGARIMMLDSLSQTETGPALDDDEADGAAAAYVELDAGAPAAADGGPDPLSIVQNLLPGGRWVLGKAPIVHSPTELETELLPRLLDGPPTLVILSGNAGDGKTAFIETVLQRAGVLPEPDPARAATSAKEPVANEYPDVSLEDNRYRVVLDGSEDTNKLSNAQLLHGALGAFRGDAELDVQRGTLIAVNKGRLLSFLEGERDQYGALWRLASRRFADGDDVPDSKYILIDLNDRTVVGPALDDSLLGQVLARLLGWNGWNSCSSCDARAECPVQFNLAALAEERVRRRLWEVFALIDLDDRLHVTARHVVTRVASIISGGLRCSDIRATTKSNGRFPERSYFYTGAFLGRAEESSVEEAALNEIARAYDPAQTSRPERDGKIGSEIAQGRLAEDQLSPASLPSSDLAAIHQDIRSLGGRAIDAPTRTEEMEYREAYLELVGRILRRRFFLGDDGGATEPVQSFGDFLAVVNDGDEAELTARVLASLNATLGIGRVINNNLIVPRDYSRGLAGSGFALQVPATCFSVVRGTGRGTPFIEGARLPKSWPRSLILVAREQNAGSMQEVASLSIPLLMLEILNRARSGFRPISRTERTYMVRVAAFYRRLAEHQWTTQLDHVLYEHGRIRAGVAIQADTMDFWVP